MRYYSVIKLNSVDRLLSLIKLTVLFCLIACSTTQLNASSDNDNQPWQFVKREFTPEINGKWIGNGISYSPYRDGESPDKDSLTSKINILEDLRLIANRWNLIRMYGADQQSQRVLEVIRDNNLPIRVLQGAWLSGHYSRQQNAAQVDKVITMAKGFPEIIVAVNIGNEIFVDWSWHKISDQDQVIAYIRNVRSNISQPVTVCDDYNFWNKPHARKIADEIDFIGLHAYAFWNNKTMDVAMDWTESTYQDIQKLYPDHMIAYTETGWPTSRVYDDSYEGGLIGKASEEQQKIFFDEYNRWVDNENIVSFYFAAFDELWKGGFDGKTPMLKAEKNWGVYFSDRTHKLLLQ